MTRWLINCWRSSNSPGWSAIPGGQAALLLSNGLATGRLAPEARQNYLEFIIGTKFVWKALETMVAGAQLPASLLEAMTAAKLAYFDPQYIASADQLLNATIAGEKPDGGQWGADTIKRLGTAVTVAERALDEARRHTTMQWSSARQSLILNMMLLASALALAIGTMMLVGRRAIKPLHAIRDGMLKVAAGDLTVDAGYTERRDEIGALAGALATFKQQAVEKARIEHRSASETPGPRRDSRPSSAISANSRPRCVGRWSNWATPLIRCGQPRMACRRFPRRPTQASRSLPRPRARRR